MRFSLKNMSQGLYNRSRMSHKAFTNLLQGLISIYTGIYTNIFFKSLEMGKKGIYTNQKTE